MTKQKAIDKVYEFVEEQTGEPQDVLFSGKRGKQIGRLHKGRVITCYMLRAMFGNGEAAKMLNRSASVTRRYSLRAQRLEEFDLIRAKTLELLTDMNRGEHAVLLKEKALKEFPAAYFCIDALGGSAYWLDDVETPMTLLDADKLLETNEWAVCGNDNGLFKYQYGSWYDEDFIADNEITLGEVSVALGGKVDAVQKLVISKLGHTDGRRTKSGYAVHYSEKLRDYINAEGTARGCNPQ